MIKLDKLRYGWTDKPCFKRWWTSLQGESFTVLSTASLFSSIEASSVLFYHPFTNKKCRNTCQICVWRRRQIRKKYWISVLVPKSVWYGAQGVIKWSSLLSNMDYIIAKFSACIRLILLCDYIHVRTSLNWPVRYYNFINKHNKNTLYWFSCCRGW